MNQMRLWAAAGIIAVILILGFVFSVPHTRDVGQTAAAPLVNETPVVTLLDTYRMGTHTLSGYVLAPNACASVTAAATTTGTSASTTALALALTMPSDTGICLQVPTKVTYSAQAAAPEGVPITVTLDGSVASTTTP